MEASEFYKDIHISEDRIQVSKKHCDVYIIDTEQGFILDVYDKSGNLITTDTFWNDDFQNGR